MDNESELDIRKNRRQRAGQPIVQLRDSGAVAAEVKTKTFREACCERFGIGPDAFEEEVLWRCFYPHALRLGRFLWRWLRSYFADDLDLIRSVADCADANDVRTELSDYRYHHPVSGFLRRFLRVRVSGQRLVDLATEVLSERHSDDSGRQRSCSEF